ncbi:uncharacterized protein LOC142358377 [Convolutriloba macropyga]|uniref:uncharacterized protein LOC142358377 n=1 Tax=Convolutriloba macropyga TaxID=536237 RepID=UPI003F51BE34
MLLVPGLQVRGSGTLQIKPTWKSMMEDYYRIRSPLELPPASSSANTPWRCAKDGVAPIPHISWIYPVEQSAHMHCPKCSERFELAAPSVEARMPDASPSESHAGASCSNSLAQNQEPAAVLSSHQIQAEPARISKAAQLGPHETHSKSCVICLEGVADCALIPCGHLCLCEDCAYSLRDMSPNCPMCRQPSIYAQRIYV